MLRDKLALRMYYVYEDFDYDFQDLGDVVIVSDDAEIIKSVWNILTRDSGIAQALLDRSLIEMLRSGDGHKYAIRLDYNNRVHNKPTARWFCADCGFCGYCEIEHEFDDDDILEFLTKMFGGENK